MKKLPNCEGLAASRVAFAWQLHFSDKYEACLQVLELVLTEQPALDIALTCKADTLIHLERYEEAFVITGTLLESNRANGDAWKIRGNLFAAKHDWIGLLKNCSRWLAHVSEDSKSRFDAFQHLAVAYCALGRTREMEVWIKAWANFGTRKRNLDSIRRAVFRRAGKESPK